MRGGHNSLLREMQIILPFREIFVVLIYRCIPFDNNTIINQETKKRIHGRIDSSSHQIYLGTTRAENWKSRGRDGSYLSPHRVARTSSRSAERRGRRSWPGRRESGCGGPGGALRRRRAWWRRWCGRQGPSRRPCGGNLRAWWGCATPAPSPQLLPPPTTWCARFGVWGRTEGFVRVAATKQTRTARRSGDISIFMYPVRRICYH